MSGDHSDNHDAILREFQQALAGDREAFNQLYKRFHPRLSVYLKRHFTSIPSDLHHDLIQDMFLALQQKEQVGLKDGHVERYLLGVLRNLANRHQRSELRHMSYEYATARHEVAEADDFAFSEEQELRDRVLIMIEEMREPRRMIWRLFATQTSNLKKISQITGLSYDCVANHIKRGKSLFRIDLGDLWK